MTDPEKIKVLLIDDHELARGLLRQILKGVGFTQVREAADGDAGLAMARHFQPDLICLDNKMPGKSGLELLGELKVAVPRSAVLMVTASNDKDTVVACLNAGASGYILKPFSTASLVKIFENVLAKREKAPAGP